MTEPETGVIEEMKRIDESYDELSKMGFDIDEIAEILQKSPALKRDLVDSYLKAKRRKLDELRKLNPRQDEGDGTLV